MDKVVVNSYEDFEKLLGRQIGISDYVEVSQDRINLFADATLDHQWIHVDTERAKVESPYHSTIVHGYLTLSLLPHMWNQIIEVNNLKMMINYGMDKMKFGQAVHPEGLHCPIRGDELYGQKADRLYLHAESLEFVHPVTKEIIFVEKKSNF